MMPNIVPRESKKSMMEEIEAGESSQPNVIERNDESDSLMSYYEDVESRSSTESCYESNQMMSYFKDKDSTEITESSGESDSEIESLPWSFLIK